MAKKPSLTIPALQATAAEFAEVESLHGEPTLYGVTDGKAVGTYLEMKFRSFLAGAIHLSRRERSQWD